MTWLTLQQDPDWQLINFEITPTATFNPFKYHDPEVDDLIAEIHDAATEDEAAAAVKELNAYLVEQAWFAPWYRHRVELRDRRQHQVVPQTGNAYPYLWNFTPKAAS